MIYMDDQTRKKLQGSFLELARSSGGKSCFPSFLSPVMQQIIERSFGRSLEEYAENISAAQVKFLKESWHRVNQELKRRDLSSGNLTDTFDLVFAMKLIVEAVIENGSR